MDGSEEPLYNLYWFIELSSVHLDQHPVHLAYLTWKAGFSVLYKAHVVGHHIYNTAYSDNIRTCYLLHLVFIIVIRNMMLLSEL